MLRTGGSVSRVIGDVDIGAVGVYGWVGSTIAPAAPGRVAVHAAAQATNLVALNVVGKARFSRSGRVTRQGPCVEGRDPWPA